MKRFGLLLALGIASFFIVIISAAPSVVAQTIPDRVQAVYDSTDAQTEIPLMVPSVVPLGSQAAPTEYWAVGGISPSNDKYVINFNRAEDCTGAEECSFALASGEIRSDTDPALEYLFGQPSRTGAEEISLANGIDAVYIPARDGLYMPSYVYWDISEYRYSVGIYMGEKDEVMEMANSSIERE